MTTDVDLARSVAELRRRADELSVLNDLARRLAALHDTRDILDEVARQARRQLGADVSYIMLLQPGGPDGDPPDLLRLEVVDGAMGQAMRGIEVVPGHGLAGRVLATGRPLRSESYLDDTRLARNDYTDAVARNEQLGGVLGVPLVVGDDTIGVLLAAQRRTRVFSDGEVELLAGLATHAALALRTADLFRRERAAVAELRAANAALRAVGESRRRDNELRDVLTQAVLQGDGLTAVVQALQQTAGLAVEVRDPEGRTVAGEHVEDGVVVRVDLPSGSGGELVATAGDDAEETRRLLRIGATTVAVLLASERSVVEAELRSRGEFVHALLSSEADEASVLRRARALDLDLRAVTTVAVLDPVPVGTIAAAAFAARLVTDLGGWSAEHAERVVVLLPTTVEQVSAAIARLSGGETATPTTGLAAASVENGGIRSAYDEARQTAALLRALDRVGACATSAELGLYRSLFSSSGREELSSFLAATVGPLLRYDAEHQRDLTATLETYLEQSRHHARTCEVLHIHPNTLYQRLARVGEVLGEEWKEPGRALELQVALRLQRLRDRPL